MSLSLSLQTFRMHLAAKETLLLDLRHQDSFVKKHIPKAIFTGIEGPFEKWIQLVVPNKQTNLLLVLPKEAIETSINKLKNLGFTNILGYLEGGISNWELHYQTESIVSIDPADYLKQTDTDNIVSIDVRKKSEYIDAHISKTNLIPLEINEGFLSLFDKLSSYHIFCGGGYRSVIAISYLRKNGIQNLTNIEKGFRGIKEALTDAH
ncbi:rhodanese-like domain-containing protein [Flavicella sp.]|uniref:rhodanese-like domain-containing protein n=1 Tax=Flavicella sp. TaxID=2957742 RepID=UPI002630A3E0|nr:rhodanese-like domain-containing protein [Flavicella sp.]MDG1804823.1 rhodanese-like domain-containing protein [Flavicella sp.]